MLIYLKTSFKNIKAKANYVLLIKAWFICINIKIKKLSPNKLISINKFFK